MRTGLARACLCALLAACTGPSVQPPDVPALVVNADDASRQELRQVVAAALHGAPVTLADDALTLHSELLIEQGRPAGPNGTAAVGRNPGRPERFQLVQDGPQCLLVQAATGLRWLLLDTECRPE